MEYPAPAADDSLLVVDLKRLGAAINCFGVGWDATAAGRDENE